MTKKIIYGETRIEECSWEAFRVQVESEIKKVTTFFPDACNFTIEIATSLGYYDSIEAVIILTFKRLETDEEYNARLEDERSSADKREAFEKAEFERLKKKFNGDK